jgi:hypothetical protein
VLAVILEFWFHGSLLNGENSWKATASRTEEDLMG